MPHPLLRLRRRALLPCPATPLPQTTRAGAPPRSGARPTKRPRASPRRPDAPAFPLVLRSHVFALESFVFSPIAPACFLLFLGLSFQDGPSLPQTSAALLSRRGHAPCLALPSCHCQTQTLLCRAHTQKTQKTKTQHTCSPPSSLRPLSSPNTAHERARMYARCSANKTQICRVTRSLKKPRILRLIAAAAAQRRRRLGRRGARCAARGQFLRSQL